jgi:hypothetical protein
MNFVIHKLVSGSNGTGFSCVLNTEKRKSNEIVDTVQTVLINCGDSTQIALSIHKFKLQKLSLIIFSSLAPHNTSGLVGLLIALSDLVSHFISIILSIVIFTMNYLGK